LTDDETKEKYVASLIGQELNPIDISDMNLDAVAIKTVGQLLTKEYSSVSSLSKESIAKCDKVVELLGLDKQRGKYF
jgi:hypothetical protein